MSFIYCIMRVFKLDILGKMSLFSSRDWQEMFFFLEIDMHVNAPTSF